MDYEQRKVAHALLKSHTDGQVAFKDLRKFHYNILCRSDMKESGAEVLAGLLELIGPTRDTETE